MSLSETEYEILESVKKLNAKGEDLELTKPSQAVRKLEEKGLLFQHGDLLDKFIHFDITPEGCKTLEGRKRMRA